MLYLHVAALVHLVHRGRDLEVGRDVKHGRGSQLGIDNGVAVALRTREGIPSSSYIAPNGLQTSRLRPLLSPGETGGQQNRKQQNGWSCCAPKKSAVERKTTLGGRISHGAPEHILLACPEQ